MPAPVAVVMDVFNSSPGVLCPAMCWWLSVAGWGSETGCTRCPAGSYNPNLGAVACGPCPTSAPYSPVGSKSSASCVKVCPDTTWNFWLDTAVTEGAHSCWKIGYAANLKKPGQNAVNANQSCSASSTSGPHLLTSAQVRLELAASEWGA